MSIIGIGTDIVQHHRIASVWENYNLKFAKRILAESEWNEFKDKKFPVAFLAKRFAAKEAVAKAFGKGIGAFMAFKDIAITHTPEGQPQVVLSGKALLLLKSQYHIHISISDERDLAMAFVVIEKSI